MKRFALIWLACALLLPACNSRSDKKTVEFWTLQLSPTFDTYFHSIIAEYEKKHPDISIRWVDIPYDAAVQKLLASVVAGNAPDVVNLSGDFLAKFASMNAFLDLKSIIPADSLAAFLPNAMDVCTADGKYVALPWYLNTYVIIFNKALLTGAGMSETDIPRTFADLASVVKRYKDSSGKFAIFWNIGKDSYLPTMLESEGVAMTDQKISIATFNSPRGIELISQWVDLYRGGYLQRESIISPGTKIIEAYQSGQVAMVFTGPVFLGRVKTNAPSIFATTGVADNPVGITGKQELATMVISVMASTKFPRESADFTQFVLNAENQLAFSKIEPTFPSVTAALKDPYFTKDDGTLEGRARIVGARELPASAQLSIYKQHPEYVRLKEIFDEAIQKACLGSATTKDALDEAVRQWNVILQKGTK
ncbi:MAG: sugar ABC transporter substrate-binding protein [Ignavibacteriales bacterium]|nr:sugar ABC transporter substrate-binding protein [Ignavibacteriales bacterium]